MKLTRTFSLLLCTLAFTAAVAAQSRFQVAQITPYDKAVPGEIMQLMVEGMEGGFPPAMLPAEDFKLTVSQDGVSQAVKVRAVSPILRSKRPTSGQPVNPNEMESFQGVSFVVPHGLHPGAAELTLSYRGETDDAITLTILDKPLRPLVASLVVMTVTTSALPPPPSRLEGNNLGWRLERGAPTRLLVQPLTDPDDPNSAILVRFKQGDNSYDETARLVSQPSEVINGERGVGFFPAREFLEVDVPAALAMGPVELEIRIRANGQEGEPATVRATVSDATRAFESPLINAPRLLLVSPTRVGVGQSLVLSIDYRRTIEPDPANTLVAVEQGNARYVLKPEKSTAVIDRNKAQDAPVLVIVRPNAQIVGKAQVRIFNELRGQQTGASEPSAIEIVAEPTSPELLGVRESTPADLARLRQMYELQTRAGRKFPDYDPQRKYLTINVKGIDFDPSHVRITLTQNSRSFTLTPADFSLYSNDVLIVRSPQDLAAGAVKLTIQNRGIESFSAPAGETFEICCTP